MKLTTLKGSFGNYKKKRHEADHSKRGALVIIKQTRHEADYSKGELW